MRIIASMLAALALVTASARDTNRYDRVETRGGIEFSQRGGLGNSNEVVTAVSVKDFVPTFTNESAKAAFSNAVSAVSASVDPTRITGANGDFISYDGSAKRGGADTSVLFRGDAAGSVDGTGASITGDLDVVVPYFPDPVLDDDTVWVLRTDGYGDLPTEKTSDVVTDGFSRTATIPQDYPCFQYADNLSVSACYSYGFERWFVTYGKGTSTGSVLLNAGTDRYMREIAFDYHGRQYSFVRVSGGGTRTVRNLKSTPKEDLESSFDISGGVVSNGIVGVVSSTKLPLLSVSTGDVWFGADGTNVCTYVYPGGILVVDTWVLSRDAHHSTSQGVIRAELPLYVRHADIGSSSICDNMIYKKVAGVNEWAWDSALSSANVTGPSVFEKNQAVSVGGTKGNLKFNGSQWGFTASVATWWIGKQYSKNSLMPLGGQKTLVAAMQEMLSSGSSNLGYGSTVKSNVQTTYEQSLFHIHSSDPGSGEFISWTAQIPYDWYDNERRTLHSSVTNDLKSASSGVSYRDQTLSVTWTNRVDNGRVYLERAAQ